MHIWAYMGFSKFTIFSGLAPAYWTVYCDFPFSSSYNRIKAFILLSNRSRNKCLSMFILAPVLYFYDVHGLIQFIKSAMQLQQCFQVPLLCDPAILQIADPVKA